MKRDSKHEDDLHYKLDKYRSINYCKRIKATTETVKVKDAGVIIMTSVNKVKS